MFGSVWNRVFLLATGMAFGWNLVHVFAASSKRRNTVSVRTYLGLGLGIVAIVTLAVTGADALITGLFVFLFSAFVAYAGNAKQVSKTERLQYPLLELEAGDKRELADRIGVLLVGDLLPQTYTDSLHWARVYALMDRAGEKPPHWFVRPVWYGRIRKALAEGSPPVDAATLARLCHETRDALGRRFVVETASTLVENEIVDMARDMAARGTRQIIIAPLSADTVDRDVLQSDVSRSRVRDARVRVRITAPNELRLLPPSYEMVTEMLSGAPIDSTQPFWDDAQIRILRKAILDRVR